MTTTTLSTTFDQTTSRSNTAQTDRGWSSLFKIGEIFFHLEEYENAIDMLEQGLSMARDMNRKTLALRVDPANGPAVSFYRKAGFTTVATVVSKKSGKLRLLMSREL